MTRSQYKREHSNASRAIPGSTFSCTTAYEGFPGLASLAKLLSLHLGLDHGPMSYQKTGSAPHSKAISSRHPSWFRKIPHISPSLLT